MNIDELKRMCNEFANAEGGTFLHPWTVPPEGLEAGPSRPDYRAQIIPAGSGPEPVDALSTPSRWGGLGESKAAAMIDLFARTTDAARSEDLASRTIGGRTWRLEAAGRRREVGSIPSSSEARSLPMNPHA